AHPVAEPGALPGRWYRSPEENHPVHKLFARQSTYPAVGSAEWTKKYPAGKLTVAQIPAEWTSALAAAVAAGKIPTDCPVASSSGGYRNSSGTMNPSREPICSSAAQCRGHDQIYDVPDGIVALSFDDGPLPAAMPLQAFLRQNNQKVTHFYIGGNILANPKIFMDAFENSGDDMAVHTWSHPHMSQQTNEMVLAELGWTMQIIHDSTGGRLPRYWRPPFGESDNRVRAIAREVFGLTTVIWNDDTNDWNIGRAQTLAGATSILTKAYTRTSKSPGLNILEHELSADTVKVFIDTYPLIAENGWTAKSIPDAMG
ncbi:glycoside hydrolase/deacetylase, partial [Ceratobasidium sp. AG-I]